MILKCLAIDDEPLALKQMVSYIQQTPFLELVRACSSAFEAMEILNEQSVDLMFVDINMPGLSGMDFVKTLANPPKIIFTTAYSEFAVEGFRVDAIDYLLKPIAYDHFLKAASKARERFQPAKPAAEKLESNDESLFIKSEYKIVRIHINDIQYVEGMREYVRFHLVNEKPLMSLLSMKSVEEKLPADQFMRVHRSYIVNLRQVSVVERNRIIFDGLVRIPVSDQYKEKFQQYLDRNFL
ncbi:MAG TPA: LytTR family DNA-binding domain-containing protein [Sunxiuqinia sp.]|nr:LytTR family DNA-binding domain-containing protein [Sunxiuqinia sp.]